MIRACDGFVDAAHEVLRADEAIQHEAQRAIDQSSGEQSAANSPQGGEPAAEEVGQETVA